MASTRRDLTRAPPSSPYRVQVKKVIWSGAVRHPFRACVPRDAPSPLSQLLYLLCHHHRVLLADTGRGRSSIVIGAVVFVGVTMDGAELVPTTAVEA